MMNEFGAPPRVRILVVDDDFANRKFMAICLARLRYACDEASNPHRAGEFLRERLYDVVVAAVRLPADACVELLNMAEGISPGVPFILVADRSSSPWAMDAVGAQVKAWLEKPIDPYDLGRAVERVLQQRALERRYAAEAAALPMEG